MLILLSYPVLVVPEVEVCEKLKYCGVVFWSMKIDEKKVKKSDVN